jgi:tellurite resistance protein TehA-like permease
MILYILSTILMYVCIILVVYFLLSILLDLFIINKKLKENENGGDKTR